jgi:macrodomain Ter protein organizer (MatP/YcbG family)
MNADELAEATKQYDAMVIDKTRPLNAKERQLWERAKRGRGRPKVGKGARKVSISLEASLLEKTDALARRTGETRSELISRLLTAGLRRRAV